jgi:hypothetical protein
MSRREIEEVAKQVRPRKKRDPATIEAARQSARILKSLRKHDSAAMEIVHLKDYFSATVRVRLAALGALLRER